MNDITQFSEKAMLLLMRRYFEPISKRHWIVTWFMKIINSKTGKRDYLHRFVARQLKNPHPELVKVAKQLKSKKDKYAYANTVVKIEEYVDKHFTYYSDDGEEWIDAIDTFMRKFDDCEGQNLLILILCYLAGVPRYKLLACLGDTADGYHCYCIYYYSPRMCFIPIDTTYYVETGPLKDQEEFKVGHKKYKYPDYAFNDKKTFKWKT